MKLIICLLIIFIFLQIQTKLLLPIKYIFDNSNDKDMISIFESYNRGYLQTQIELGSNLIPIHFKLSFDSYSTIILNSSIQNIPISYNINKSKTHQMFSFKFKFKNELIKEGYLASDIFYLNNKNNTKQKERLRFFLYNNNKDNICNEGIIGLGLNNVRDYSFPGYNFIYQLKQNSIINDYTIFFEENNNVDNLIVGEYPDINKNNISENDERIDITYNNYNNSNFNYYILIDNIIINNKIISSQIFLKFDLSTLFIEGTEIYKNYILNTFFAKYINIKKCSITKSELFGEFFYCNKDVDISQLPNLDFHIKSLNYSISLTYNNLFKFISNKFFFMVIFRNISIWKIGYSIIKQLNIAFNQDKKTVTFLNRTDYKEKNKENKKTDIINIIIIIIMNIFLLFVFLLLVLFFYYKDFKKNKNKNQKFEEELMIEMKEI